MGKEKIEKVESIEGVIDVYENDIDLYLHQFAEENGYNDISSMPQNTWTACMIYIQRHVFPDRKALKEKNNIFIQTTGVPSNCNCYDYKLLNDICDYYIYLCSIYDKECSIYGFSKLTNVNYSIIEEWGNNYRGNVKLSTLGKEIHKKLISAREQSLVGKLVSMKHPTAMAIVLNKDYNYNLPGVSRETANKRALSAAELPKLGGGTVQNAQIGIPENNTGND